jgi:hypothetical protein
MSTRRPYDARRVARNANELGRLLGLSGSNAVKSWNEGLTFYQADRAAAKVLESHIDVVWPERAAFVPGPSCKKRAKP